MVKIAIVNYGLGNLRGVQIGVHRAGGEAIATGDAREIRHADAIILPGVGAFSDAIRNLAPIKDVVLSEAKSGKPLLGICLGLQLLFTYSFEGGYHEGLGLIEGGVVKLPSSVKIPHMGWNKLKIVKESPIVRGVPSGAYVYFVHSYYAEPKDKGVIVATTNYGVEIPSIVASRNIYAAQFHPEKSAAVGVRMLKNFISEVKR